MKSSKNVRKFFEIMLQKKFQDAQPAGQFSEDDLYMLIEDCLSWRVRKTSEEENPSRGTQVKSRAFIGEESQAPGHAQGVTFTDSRIPKSCSRFFNPGILKSYGRSLSPAKDPLIPT